MGIVFDEKELTILGHYDSIKPEKPGVPKLNSPVTTKENLMAALNGKKPCWYPMVGMAGGDYKPFRPSRTFPDLFVAHDAMSGETPVEWDKIDKIQDGWFDTKWRYVDQVGGAMIEPGTEKIESIQDWEKLTWPDLDQLDWEGSAKANAAYLNSELPIEFCVPTTYWERIMSILGVSNAAVMMIEEEDKEACNAFFTKLTDLYVDMMHRVKKYYNPDIILMHDDWGHQRGPFFSRDTFDERLLPHFKRIVSEIHSLGMRFELHCCGKAEAFVPEMIEIGIDLWIPQDMNNVQELARKYRDKGITFGVYVPIIAPGMPNEEELAKKTAQDFYNTYGDGPVAYVNYGFSDILYQYMYEYGRKAYSD
jgi:hypothetical protein